MKNKLKIFLNNNIETIFITIYFSLSIIVMVGWYLGNLNIIKLLTVSNTMKFNTALVFFLTGIILCLFNKTNKLPTTIYNVISILIIFIGVFTLLQDIGFSFFNIDNLFVTDVFSKENPGRMSPASAICSLTIGIGFLGFNSKNKNISIVNTNSILLASILSFIVIISYVLLVSTKNKFFIFKTMSIETSILFFALSLFLMIKKKNSKFNRLFSDKYIGSRIFKKILPFLLLFPIFIANFLLFSIYNKWIVVEYGIVTYTIIFIPTSIIYISYLAFKLNDTDKKKQRLHYNLTLTNEKIIEIQHAIEQTAIFSITDTKGIIKYASDSFCQMSKFSKEELVGNSHAIVNSNTHNSDYFKNLWVTITSGETWSGIITNLTKEGKLYKTNITIIPIKDSDGKIIEYIEVNDKFVGKF